MKPKVYYVKYSYNTHDGLSCIKEHTVTVVETSTLALVGLEIRNQHVELHRAIKESFKFHEPEELVKHSERWASK